LRRFLLVCAAVAALVCLVVPGLASARGTYTCTGSVNDGVLFGPQTPMTIDANVDVPAGASCFMYLTTVTGNITVEGTLGGFGITVQKNLIADGGTLLLAPCFSLLCGTLPLNDVQGNTIVTNPSASVELARTHFEKNVIVSGGADGVTLELMSADGRVIVTNSADVLAFDASFNDDVSFVDNTNVAISSVDIAGTLDCEANTPAATVGVGVNAAASRGECAL
jgi:hypothetical protein